MDETPDQVPMSRLATIFCLDRMLETIRAQRFDLIEKMDGEGTAEQRTEYHELTWRLRGLKRALSVLAGDS